MENQVIVRNNQYDIDWSHGRDWFEITITDLTTTKQWQYGLPREVALNIAKQLKEMGYFGTDNRPNQ
jgi:hypothetical protein